jgi:predicted RecA/RadA family phage recombinase
MGRKVSEACTVKCTATAPAVIHQGDFCYLEGFLGIAIQEIMLLEPGTTSEVVLAIEPGVYETNQITPGDTFSKGAKIYWDAQTSLFTTTQNDIFAGTVVQEADTNGVIWFILGR